MPGTKRPGSQGVSGSQHPQPRGKKRRKTPSDVPPVESRLDNDQLELSGLWQWRLESVTAGEVFYLPNFIDSEVSNDWYTRLDKLDTWYHPTLKVYGKEVLQSRSIAAYATSERITAKYSGHQVTMHYDYPEILTVIQDLVEKRLGTQFNHVMLNKYHDGKEYIGRHRDTKENKVIASLSLGAERTFIFSPNKNCPGHPSRHSLTLKDGSLLIMQGDTQKYWKHEIPKEPKLSEGRISLTFRQLQKE